MLFIQIPKAKIIEIEKRIEEKQRQKITVEVVLKFYLHNYQGDHPQTIHRKNILFFNLKQSL